MKRALILVAVVCIAMTGCTAPSPAPEKTQMQIRQFQTRIFDEKDTKLVMKALIDALQDDGFIIKNAVPELGLLTASKEVDIENRAEAFFTVLFQGQEATWPKNSIVEASINASEFGDKIRVRANFQVKILNNRGGIITIRRIEDPEYYRDFFTKVDKGLFLLKEKL